MLTHYLCSKTRNLYKSSEYYLDGVANAACSGQRGPVEEVSLSRFAISTQVARPLRLMFRVLGALFHAQSMRRILLVFVADRDRRARAAYASMLHLYFDGLVPTSLRNVRAK